MNLDEIDTLIRECRASLNNFEDGEKKTHLNLCLVELNKNLIQVRARATTIKDRVNALKFRTNNELQQRQGEQVLQSPWVNHDNRRVNSNL